MNKTLVLCEGTGVEGQSHCVMTAASILSGDEFRDDPKCVCPTLREICVCLNDGLWPDSELEADQFRHKSKLKNEMLSDMPWLLINTNGGLIHAHQRADLYIEKFFRTVEDLIPAAKKKLYILQETTKYTDGLSCRRQLTNKLALCTCITNKLLSLDICNESIKYRTSIIEFVKQTLIPVYKENVILDTSLEDRLHYAT